MISTQLSYKRGSLNLPFISPTPGHITIVGSAITILNTVENTQDKVRDVYSNVVDMGFDLLTTDGNSTTTQPNILNSFKEQNFIGRLGTLDTNVITDYVNALKDF